MKYVVCNLKSHLNDFNIKDYLETIKKITYKNVIFCVSNDYINLFNGYKLCTQDYYEEIEKEYALIGHYEKHEPKEVVKDKLNKAIHKNIKIILCIGNSDINNYDEVKNQLKYYLNNTKNIIIAYEPYEMIGSNNEIDIREIENIVKKIKNDFNNIKVLYGGNVNENNIERILDVTDGVLIGRFSYNPHKFTKIINKIEKSI